MRVARAVDARAARSATKPRFARIATAIGKYWVCKRAPAFVNEAQECLGGAGYVEESMLPRLYRQAPLNSIWEGSGNIQCLDVLRALSREPEAGARLLAELELARGLHEDYDSQLASLRPVLGGDTGVEESQARRWVEAMALTLQGGLLLRHGSPVAEGFCRTRLGGDHGNVYGTLPEGVDLPALIDRALPA